MSASPQSSGFKGRTRLGFAEGVGPSGSGSSCQNTGKMASVCLRLSLDGEAPHQATQRGQTGEHVGRVLRTTGNKAGQRCDYAKWLSRADFKDSLNPSTAEWKSHRIHAGEETEAWSCRNRGFGLVTYIVYAIIQKCKHMGDNS